MPTTAEPRPMPKCWSCQDWGTLIDHQTGREYPCPQKCPASKKIRR